MEILTKCQCGSPVLSDAKIEDGIIIVEVELCPKCVARAIQLSEEDEWMRNKYLKEGGYTDYEIRKKYHPFNCKCRDCQDQRGDEEYQRRKDDALTEKSDA